MNMKWAFLMVILSLHGISASAQEENVADTCHFKVNVSQMMPVSYPSRTLSYGFSLELRNDSALVYLPYMGRVYQPVLNDDGLLLRFP